MSMEKTKEFTVILKAHIFLADDEATESTVRYLLEEDLRDKGWDCEINLVEEQ